jgi:sulfatase-modifying factor enzyme 1
LPVHLRRLFALVVFSSSACTRPSESPSALDVAVSEEPPAPGPEAESATLDAKGSDPPPDAPPPDAQPPFAMPASAGPHEWRLLDGGHWQIVSPPGEDPSVTDEIEKNRGACQPGMIEIQGKMKTGWLMDERQQAVCTKWINRNFPERCAVFDRDKWLAASAALPTKPMHFCIERFEHPNKRGEFPMIVVNWFEAKAICVREQKRLCTEAEWTFACEGEEATPYPYGYVRDPDACVVDHRWIPFDPQALSHRNKAVTKKELERLWQGEPSGLRPRCKSVFGVYDMIGNIDEWTTSTSPGRPSILKGGYWGPVRTRCRPSTRAHGEAHVFYQQGLRCCADLPSKEAGVTVP